MKSITVLLYIILFFSDAMAYETFRIYYKQDRVMREYPEKSHPVIGLALSGGGARGIAHIGVIEVLEKNGIIPYCVAGTSIGSIIGGLYAAGYNPKAIVTMFTNIGWNIALSDIPNRRSIYVSEKETSNWPILDLRFNGLKIKLPYSLSYGQKIISQLSWLALEPTYFCGGDFDKLEKPYRSIATDFVRGKEVVIGNGNLARAMQGSSTIPLMFYPVEHQGNLLVDGGLKNNLPVDVVRNMGSDFVIADVVDENMHDEMGLDSFFNVADQATSILMRNLTILSRDKADYVIDHDDLTQFKNIPDMIEKGREAADAVMPELLKKLDDLRTRYDKTFINSVFTYPEKYSEKVNGITRKYFNLNEETYYPRIISAIEEVWRSGEFSEVKVSLDKKSGVLTFYLQKSPSYINLAIAGYYNSKDKMEVVSGNENPDIHNLIASVDSLLHVVRLTGMSFASINEMRLSPSGDSLTFFVESPEITRITISDNLKTRRSVITREFLIHEGEILNLGNLMKTVENLYGTNLFDLVYPDVSHYRGGVAVHINIKEKDWSAFKMGLRYDETNGTEGRISLSSENLMGFGGKFRATAHTGAKEKLIMLQNRNDRILKTYYTFDFRTYNVTNRRPVYSNHSDYVEYRDIRYGTVMSLGQQMDKLGNAVFMFKTETMRTKFSPSSGMKNEKKELRSISMESVIDTYDRYPFPKSGKMNIIFIESASKFLGGSEKFVKIYWNSNYVRTLAKRHTFGGGFSLGTADKSTPYMESFTLGGAPTRLNCYDYDGSMSHFYADFMGLAHDERYGNYLAVGKVSYSMFIPKYFHLDFIYSAGNVWDNREPITLKSTLQSYGIQGTFESYFGPINAGWGITSKGDDMLYLSAGWEF